MEASNKLIAEFMGIENTNGLVFQDANTKEFHSIKYHTSWDWLMPVISKITKDERCVENEYRERIMDVVPYGNIEDTIEAVVEFIKEYNLNN